MEQYLGIWDEKQNKVDETFQKKTLYKTVRVGILYSI